MMPLSRWAKMLMLVEPAASLVLALTVAARAIPPTRQRPV
jgi:hypothetical protein